MFLTICGNDVCVLGRGQGGAVCMCVEGVVAQSHKVWKGKMGNEPFPKVNFYVLASSKCLSHNGCQISLLKMKKKFYIFHEFPPWLAPSNNPIQCLKESNWWKGFAFLWVTNSGLMVHEDPDIRPPHYRALFSSIASFKSHTVPFCSFPIPRKQKSSITSLHWCVY